MNKVNKYYNVMHFFFQRPGMYVGKFDVDIIFTYWTAFNSGWDIASPYVNIYAYDFHFFYTWFLHKMKANNLYYLGVEKVFNIKVEEKKISKDAAGLWFIELLKEYFLLKPIKVFHCQKELGSEALFLYKIQQHLPWTLLEIKDGYVKKTVLNFRTQKRNASDLTLEKKYQLEMKSWVINRLKMNFKTDFEPYDLEEFMEKYYYADFKKPSDEIEN